MIRFVDAPPASPLAGQKYWDLAAKRYKTYNGTAWKEEIPDIPGDNWMAANAKAETVPAQVVTGTFTLVSGTLYCFALSKPLRAGQTYTAIGFQSANTVASGWTNQWFALVRKSDLHTLRSTTDDTTTSWGQNASKVLNLSSSYTPTDDTDVYLALMVAATTPNNIAVKATNASIANRAPIVAGTSNTGQTTPPADDTALTALTGVTSIGHGWVI